MWKLTDGEDPLKKKHWREKEFYIAKTGTLCSVSKQRRMWAKPNSLVFGDRSVVSLAVEEVLAGTTCFDYSISLEVTPRDVDFPRVVLGTDDEEVMEEFMDTYEKLMHRTMTTGKAGRATLAVQREGSRMVQHSGTGSTRVGHAGTVRADRSLGKPGARMLMHPDASLEASPRLSGRPA